MATEMKVLGSIFAGLLIVFMGSFFGELGFDFRYSKVLWPLLLGSGAALAAMIIGAGIWAIWQ